MATEEEPSRRTHQNTFQLKPKKSFDPVKVKTHMVNIMELNLKEVEYSDQVMKDLCMTISDEIRAAIKGENYDRYRIVVTVVIGEKKMHGVNIEHSFLWDEDRDRYVEHLYETTVFYAQCVVYGIYWD